MARPLRLDAPGEFVHVLARGNERAQIYADDRDRELFLALLAEVSEQFEVRCHGYCLMGNHYHLLLQPLRGELPRALRQLNGIYAQRFNRRHRRVGHLFEGRYKSLLVDHQTYLIELARYIVLNPVRAGIVAAPEDWPWSSYRGTAGLEAAPAFLHVEFIRRAAGGRDGAAGALDFRRLVAIADVAETDIGRIVEQAAALGGRAFSQRAGNVAREHSPGREVPVIQRTVGRPSLETILVAKPILDRDDRIRSAVLEHGYSQVAVARTLGLGRSTVSRAIRSDPSRSRRFPGS